jgi:DNA-binding response OmpR family regulator
MSAPGSHQSPGPGDAATSVLIVEDDAGIAAQLVRALTRGGYQVEHVATGQDALGRGRPDVVLLDLELPDLDGVQVCRKLRERGDAAIIVITAHGEEPDRVLALDAGADDYLVKPFDFSELLARIRALLRRPSTAHEPRLACGDLVFDPATRSASVGSAVLRLTSTELSILELLLRRAPGVVARRSIALQVWDEEADAVGSNTIDVHLARLRAKLSGTRARIETVRGVGYRIAAS